MLLVLGREILLDGQALVLFCAGLRAGGFSYCGQIILVQAGLLGEPITHLLLHPGFLPTAGAERYLFGLAKNCSALLLEAR